MINKEITSYISGTVKYDPLKVIGAIRVRVEEIVYNQLSGETEKNEFIELHITTKKLHYAIDHGADVDEIFFLLQHGLI